MNPFQVFLKKKSISIENQCRFHENSKKLPVTQSYAITVKKQSNHDDIFLSDGISHEHWGYMKQHPSQCQTFLSQRHFAYLNTYYHWFSVMEDPAATEWTVNNFQRASGHCYSNRCHIRLCRWVILTKQFLAIPFQLLFSIAVNLAPWQVSLSAI